ncbi:helix-turn-helix domain-containing protein [Micromonospora sp. NPDC050686]|uniref:helix-turn-helix domain-containing protein n=1 Tax=Micromonospora sp. NPDC050686 TaxID=3154631 RepID=UPI0033EACF52
MPTLIRPDRLRQLLDAIVDTLGAEPDGPAAADRVHLSRFHFDRLVSAGVREAPGALRRRLLLERAAWQLSHGMSVTEAGLRAGYDWTESFSRAFSRAHGISPSGFQASGRDFRIGAPNGVHFHPPDGVRLPATGEESGAMDLTDRLLDHDRWLTDQLIERAASLPAATLDREIRPGHVVLAFDGPEQTVRAMLDRLVWTKEVWTAAMMGHPLPDEPDRSVGALRARHATSSAQFRGLVQGIRERGEWDDAFIDALCDPPQTFTFGGAVAHVVTFSAHRRQVLLSALAELEGVTPDSGCPIEWERLRMARYPHAISTLRGTTP